jgi:hypothetical protein
VFTSILVALDATPASSQHKRLAIDLSERPDAQMTGLAILDRARISSPTPDGTGCISDSQPVHLRLDAAINRQVAPAASRSREFGIPNTITSVLPGCPNAVL